MKGRRIPTPPDSWAEGQCPYGPGDYWQDAAGRWYGVTPNGLLACLQQHAIHVHADGTITAAPSILTGGGGLSWHGHLHRGVWKEC